MAAHAGGMEFPKCCSRRRRGAMRIRLRRETILECIHVLYIVLYNSLYENSPHSIYISLLFFFYSASPLKNVLPLSRMFLILWSGMAVLIICTAMYIYRSTQYLRGESIVSDWKSRFHHIHVQQLSIPIDSSFWIKYECATSMDLIKTWRFWFFSATSEDYVSTWCDGDDDQIKKRIFSSLAFYFEVKK